jgi:hypothetical protein
VSFNDDACCRLADQFLALAEKQQTADPLMIWPR